MLPAINIFSGYNISTKVRPKTKINTSKNNL